MTGEQIGLLVLGLGVLIGLYTQVNKLITKPSTDIKEQLHAMRVQDLEYQKEMISQFGELNQRLGIQDEKVERLGIRVDENKSNIRDIHLRVACIEQKREDETQTQN